jgi:adenosylhomocysteine nucleosidase
MKAAAVTGLEAEAQVARRAGFNARPSGGVPSRTRDIAESFLREGTELLLSVGIAGALAPSLQPGAILLPRSIIDEEGRRYSADDTQHAQILAKLRQAGIAVEEGDLLGAAKAAASPARKAELFQMSQAVAVDLESQIVAQVAARAGKPFLVLRAVADKAAQALPPAAINGLAPSGKPALGRVLLSVASDPRQIPALIRLAGDTQTALDALGSALRVLSLSL